MDKLQYNVKTILDSVAGRAVLLAATKTVEPSIINRIYDMGIHTIGENRVNELIEKYDFLDKRFDIHFIGTLQRNKVKYIIDKVSLIHSLDSLALADEIELRAAKIGKVQDCLVEINVGGEESKGGIDYDEIDDFLSKLSDYKHINIRGLMCIPPRVAQNENNLLNFKKIKQKFIDIKQKKVDNRNMDILSMGMTHDYLDAIQCGATVVRIGEGIFGKRNQQQ
ncbi:MAG: YggS family pyridoxal phosphate-dependent enzyme [Clostridia bacterium]